MGPAKERLQTHDLNLCHAEQSEASCVAFAADFDRAPLTQHFVQNNNPSLPPCLNISQPNQPKHEPQSAPSSDPVTEGAQREQHFRFPAEF